MPKSITVTKSNAVNQEHTGDQVDVLTVVLSNPMGSNKPGLRKTHSQTAPIEKIDGIVIGKVVGGESVQVDYPGNPTGGPLTALSTCKVSEEDIDRDVALAFEDSDPWRPIIIGFIHQLQNGEKGAGMEYDALNVQLDGERLKLTANKEIVLRCGDASITLTRAGKIIIRGAYLVSRSAGVNRVKGGSVQIN